METITPEQQVAKHYSAAMDSVNLINVLKAKGVLTPEDSERLTANQEHLKIMLSKTFWTTENLVPLQDASV